MSKYSVGKDILNAHKYRQLKYKQEYEHHKLRAEKIWLHIAALSALISLILLFQIVNGSS